MRTDEFHYVLPPELIAQQAVEPRDESRMMVLNRASGLLEHRKFKDLPEYLNASDVLVLNNTRVIPARIFGRKAESGGRVEILLLEELEPGIWDVLLRARRRPRPGARIILGKGEAFAELLQEGELGRARVRIEYNGDFFQLLDRIGCPPLPPYIKRNSADEEQRQWDRQRYQTIYARYSGAVAAPTAGLHFTETVLQALSKKGVRLAEITLHVGLGTFRPVEVEEVEQHVMEAERYTVSPEAAETIVNARKSGGRVVAVGTTVVRALETVVDKHGVVYSGSGRTSLFIRPGHVFRAVDVLLTNFHLPRSTLLMLVCAFAGRERVLNAYAEAVREGYRFYSYGDCMLVL